MAGEKRNVSESEDVVREESVILMDVEGTTTSISFIKETLFPYVREFLKKHIDEKWETEEFKADFAKLKEQAKKDEEDKIKGFVPIKEDTTEEAKESLIKNILWQMDDDRKTSALKALQGHMWQAAHKPIKGHVYDDIPKAFEEWTSNGKKLYIYSSGSVLAQKLLYGDTVHGDLLKYISGHFDTEVGPKQEAQSYKNIVEQIKDEPSNVLFLTDIPKEAEAAKAAGLASILVVREGNAKLSDEEKASFKTIESFAELSFKSPSKRQKLDEKESTDEKRVPFNDEKSSESTETIAVSEPMDTSDDVKVTESDKKIEFKVKKTAAEKPAENVKNSVTVMEEDSKPIEKSTPEEVPVKETTDDVKKAETIVLEEKSKTEVEADKKVEKSEKSDEAVKVAEVLEEKKVEEPAAEEKMSKAVEVGEKVSEKEVEAKNAAEVTEKVNENGDVKTEESKSDGENKENVEEKKAEPEIEITEKAKEIENNEIKETKDAEKSEVEAQPKETVSKSNGTTTNGVATKDVDEQVHTNGVSQEAKENGSVEEDSIKVKKPLADGAGESDVVSPPVVAATS